MDPSLRDYLLYPNWVLIAGIALVVIALVVTISVYVGYRRSNVTVSAERLSLSQVRQARYQRLIEEVTVDYAEGRLDGRGAHLALAAIIRAAASERLGRNVESVSVREARVNYPEWPQLIRSLQWCEAPSFGLDSEASEIARGAELAQEVVSE